jgi:hypothetical protein
VNTRSLQDFQEEEVVEAWLSSKVHLPEMVPVPWTLRMALAVVHLPATNIAQLCGQGPTVTVEQS